MEQDYLYVVNIEGAVCDGDRYLLIVRSKEEDHAAGMLCLIGGKVDADTMGMDVMEETLRREIREEVDVEIGQRMTYVHSNLFKADFGKQVVDVVFLCEYAGGKPRAVDLKEVAAVRWMTAQEVLDDPDAPPWTKASIERVERVRLSR